MQHGPFKSKVNAEHYAAIKRAKGFCAKPYQTKKGWKVSVTRK